MRTDLPMRRWEPGRYDVLFPVRIPIIADASMPTLSFEIRSGAQRVRVRWPDPETEIDRWADDGGRVP